MNNEKVNIYYFDDNGKYMVMSSTVQKPIKLPILIRYYPRFDSSISEIGNYNDRPLDYNKRKKKDKFNWYKLTLVKISDNGDSSDWVVEGLDNPNYITPDIFPVVDRELQLRLNYWKVKHCNIGYAKQHQNMYHLGHTCYWVNPVIENISNMTAHVYGKATCIAKTLRNVILIVHGELNFIEVEDYESEVSILKEQ